MLMASEQPPAKSDISLNNENYVHENCHLQVPFQYNYQPCLKDHIKEGSVECRSPDSIGPNSCIVDP